MAIDGLYLEQKISAISISNRDGGCNKIFTFEKRKGSAKNLWRDRTLCFVFSHFPFLRLILLHLPCLVPTQIFSVAELLSDPTALLLNIPKIATIPVFQVVLHKSKTRLCCGESWFWVDNQKEVPPERRVRQTTVKKILFFIVVISSLTVALISERHGNQS